MKILLKPLFWFGTCAFALVFFIHLFALLRISLIPNALSALFFPGLLIMWLPMVLLYQRLVACNGEEWRSNHFLPGMPVWIKFALPTPVLYALIEAKFIADAYAGPELFANNLRISGFLMPFYLYCSATFWVASNQPWLLEKKQCPNGHEMLRFARYCGHCGAQLSDEHDAKADH